MSEQLTRYVLIAKFCAASGYTEKAVRRKIEDGVWLQGQHYRRAPDGHIMIDVEGVERWVEGQQAPSSRSRRASGSSSRSTARARLETLELPPTPANIRAATRLLASIQDAIKAGVYRRADFFADAGPKTRESFADYADAWLDTITVAKSTKRSYTTAMRATWKPAFDGRAVSEIRFSDVKKAVADKVAGGASGKTVNNQLIPLRDLFKTAVRDRLIPTSPADGISNLKHQRPLPDPFDATERGAILAHMADRYDEQIWNYYTFAFGTGLRPSEQIALTWPDIDWRRRTATVSRALVDGEVKGTKTNLIREVDLNDDVLAALKRQKVHTLMKNPDGPIFHDPLHGKPFPNERAPRRRFFKPTLRATGIRERDAYNTRHTFATLLLMGGVNPAYIARQLGHTNTAMLFKHYSKWIDGADKGAEAAKANAILTQDGPSPTSAEVDSVH